MKPGDLVQPVVPRNHANPRVRIYDIPYNIIEEMRFPKLIGKMEEGDVALVLDVDEGGKVKILCRGVVGWLSESLLRLMDNER